MQRTEVVVVWNTRRRTLVRCRELACATNRRVLCVKKRISLLAVHLRKGKKPLIFRTVFPLYLHQFTITPASTVDFEF